MDGAAIVVELREVEPIDADQIHSKFRDTLRAVEGLNELDFLDFKVFERSSSRTIRIVATKQEGIVIRRTAESWTAAIQGARLVAPKWYAIKADWITVSLSQSGNSLGISEAAQQ